MLLQAFELARGISILLAVPAGGVPTEIQLFGKGTTETTKGPIVMDDKAGKAVMAAFKDYGLDLLPFDVGHGMLGGATPDAHKAYGWFKPAIRDGALWATDIEWTPSGKSALENREFRFFSPAVMRDFESGRVMELINVALTNIPATKRQKPLVADNSGDRPGKGTTSMDLDELLKLLGVRSAAEALSRHGDLEKLSAGLLQLSGKPTVVEALAEINRWKSQADEAVKLATQLTALQAQIGNATRDAKIEALSKAGKLPPALHALAKTFTLEQLDAFEKAAPVVLGSEDGKGPKEPPTGAPTRLDDTERAVIAQLGITEEAYLKEKAAIAGAWKAA